MRPSDPNSFPRRLQIATTPTKTSQRKLPPFPPKTHLTTTTTTNKIHSPAGPFPELYALPGLDLSAFIHVKYAWTPLTPPQIRNFHIVSRNLQLSIANNIRYHGDQKLPDKGFDKKVGRMEYWIHPIPSRRCVLPFFYTNHFLFARVGDDMDR